MNEVEVGFLDAMAETPSDPGPRIVFADYLLELHDPRAELFRTANPERALVRRELERIFPLCGEHHGLSRDGLLSYVTITLDAFLVHADTLFSLGPIHHLRITNARGRIAELAGFSPLRWALGLEVPDALETDDVTTLVASPHLARLRRLDLHNNAIGPAGAAALSTAQLPALRHLDVSWTKLATAGVRALASSPFLARLHELSIMDNGLDHADLATLLAPARELVALHLLHNDLGPAGAAAIARATHLDRLRTLSLGRCNIRNEGVQTLATAPHLASLEHLSLEDNGLTDPAVLAMMESPYLTKLKTVDISQNAISVARRVVLRDLLATR